MDSRPARRRAPCGQSASPPATPSSAPRLRPRRPPSRRTLLPISAQRSAQWSIKRVGSCPFFGRPLTKESLEATASQWRSGDGSALAKVKRGCHCSDWISFLCATTTPSSRQRSDRSHAYTYAERGGPVSPFRSQYALLSKNNKTGTPLSFKGGSSVTENGTSMEVESNFQILSF